MTIDLRKQPHDNVVSRVERGLDTTFDRATEIRKRRSVGFRTNRDTWVRIEARTLERVSLQGGSGVECAATLSGVAMPEWYQGVTWIDQSQSLMWRADETQFIATPVIKRGGTLTVEPKLLDSWWATLNKSLDALASHHTTRTATPTLVPMTQARLTSAIHQVFPNVETTVDEWTTAHGDLGWANLTAPECYLLDWEDWGMAPRAFDAAYLRSASLVVPTLADRIYRERRADFDSRSGKLSQLYACAELISAAEWAGPLLEPAKVIANDLLRELEE